MEKAKSQCQDIPEEEQVGGICLFTYSKSPSYEHSSCELSKMRTRVPSGSGWVQLQPAHLPVPTSLSRAVSHRLSLLQSVTLPACQCRPLDASSCTVLPDSSRYCSVTLKMFSLLLYLFFMYYLHENNITVQYYINDCVSWIPRPTSLNL